MERTFSAFEISKVAKCAPSTVTLYADRFGIEPKIKWGKRVRYTNEQAKDLIETIQEHRKKPEEVLEAAAV